MAYKFGYSDEMIKSIISVLNSGLARAKNSADETDGFNNATGMGKYRYIYHSMLNKMYDNLTPIKLKINSWDFTTYFHHESSSLMGIISKANFELKRNNLPDILHYMAANSEFFNVIQNNFENLLDESQKANLQLYFKIDDNPQVEKVIQAIYHDVNLDLSIVKKFVLLVADFAHYEVVDLQAVVINEKFDILYGEDWSKHIIISSQDENDMDNKRKESPQHTMNLNLRKNILSKKTDDQNEG